MRKRLRTLINKKLTEFFRGRPSWCPEGYLPCDGRAISVSRYPELFKALADAYGARVPNIPPQEFQGQVLVQVISTAFLPGRIYNVIVKHEEYERTA